MLGRKCPYCNNPLRKDAPLKKKFCSYEHADRFNTLKIRKSPRNLDTQELKLWKKIKKIE